MNNNPTTNELDKITPEERRELVGFCERHQEWYKFIDNPDDSTSQQHHGCGEMPSNRIGFQIITARTFDAKAKKLTKTQLKKMGSIGA